MKLNTVSPVTESPLHAQLVKFIFLQNLNKKILSSTRTCARVQTRTHTQNSWLGHDPAPVLSGCRKRGNRYLQLPHYCIFWRATYHRNSKKVS